MQGPPKYENEKLKIRARLLMERSKYDLKQAEQGAYVLIFSGLVFFICAIRDPYPFLVFVCFFLYLHTGKPSRNGLAIEKFENFYKKLEDPGGDKDFGLLEAEFQIMEELLV